MILKKLILVIAIAAAFSGLAQEQPTHEKRSQRRKARKHEIRLQQTRYSIQGTAAMIDVAYDSKISNNVYNGVGLALQFGNTIYDPRFLKVGIVDFMATAQSGPDLFNQYQPRFVGIESWMKWLTDSSDNFRMAWGGGVRYGYTARINTKLGNSMYSHDIFTSAVTSFYIDKWLELKNKKLLVDGRADLDLVSWINRHPGYSVIGTFKNYVRPLGGFTHLTTTIGVTLPRSKYTKENKIRINYSWGAYGMAEFDRTKKLRVAYHRIGITYYFKY